MVNLTDHDFYTMFNITDAQLDNFIMIIHNILVSLAVFYFIFMRNSEIISPLAIIIYDIASAIWQFNKISCDAIDITNILFTADEIFYELIVYTMNILLVFYAIYNKKYAAVLWIMIPATFALMKGVSCGIEKLLTGI